MSLKSLISDFNGNTDLYSPLMDWKWFIRPYKGKKNTIKWTKYVKVGSIVIPKFYPLRMVTGIIKDKWDIA